MPSSLPRVDPMRRRSAAYRGYTAFLGTGPGRWISMHVAWKIDPHLMRVTGGRLGAAVPIRTALLETRGARSGRTRRNAAIYFHDGDDVVVIPSKAGADHHPGWYHNLVADPDVVFGGIALRAEVVTDEVERHRLWTLADRVYPPYKGYRADAARAGRTIPIVRLVPRLAQAGRSGGGPS